MLLRSHFSSSVRKILNSLFFSSFHPFFFSSCFCLTSQNSFVFYSVYSYVKSMISIYVFHLFHFLSLTLSISHSSISLFPTSQVLSILFPFPSISPFFNNSVFLFFLFTFHYLFVFYSVFSFGISLYCMYSTYFNFFLSFTYINFSFSIDHTFLFLFPISQKPKFICPFSLDFLQLTFSLSLFLLPI